MKFYRDKRFYYWNKIKDNKLNAIHSHSNLTRFYRNGVEHNSRNASHVMNDSIEEFYLDGKCYGNESHFTKKSWRRFVKMQVFK
jgi:beta-lactamase class D